LANANRSQLFVILKSTHQPPAQKNPKVSVELSFLHYNQTMH